MNLKKGDWVIFLGYPDYIIETIRNCDDYPILIIEGKRFQIKTVVKSYVFFYELKDMYYGGDFKLDKSYTRKMKIKELLENEII